MNEHTQQEGEALSPGSQGEVIFLLKRLQEQLTFLERKVDVLVAQSKEKEQPKPAYDRERSYVKPPYRPSYNSERREGRPERSEGRYEGNRESRPYGKSAPGKRPSYGSKPFGQGGFGGKKKPFFGKRRAENRD